MSSMRYIAALTALVVASPAIACNSEEDAKNRMTNRSEGESQDHRTEVKDPFGLVRIGCKGNTFAANVTSSTPTVTLAGSTLTIELPYSGSYDRDGYDVPCVRMVNEHHEISGILKLVAEKPFLGNMIVKELSIINPSPIGDAGHDSNRFGAAAARKIIGSACGF